MRVLSVSAISGRLGTSVPCYPKISPGVTIPLELDHLPGAQEGCPMRAWQHYGSLAPTLSELAQPPPGQQLRLVAFKARPWPREHVRLDRPSLWARFACVPSTHPHHPFPATTTCSTSHISPPR